MRVKFTDQETLEPNPFDTLEDFQAHGDLELGLDEEPEESIYLEVRSNLY